MVYQFPNNLSVTPLDSKEKRSQTLLRLENMVSDADKNFQLTY